MNSGQYPPSPPRAPLDGGRRAPALHAGFVGHMEAREAAERRLDDAAPFTHLIDPIHLPVDATPIDGQALSLRARVQRALDVIRRRSGRAHRA